MSALWLLNFLVLQWSGVRLVRIRQRVLFGNAPACFRNADWAWLRWVWPLTGWWSPYRWIAKRW